MRKGKFLPTLQQIKIFGRKSFDELNVNKSDELDETDKFLERHKAPKLTQERLLNVNKPTKRG